MVVSSFHGFDVELAEKYGIEEAIIIHHFSHWIRINANLKKNFHEGRYWSYQTIEEITAHFPYMGKEKVRNVLDRLCNGKSRFKKEQEFEPVLIKGNFSNNKYDHTLWYAFSDSTTSIWLKHQNGLGETPNGVSENTKSISMIQILNTDTEKKEPIGSKERVPSAPKNKKIFLKFGNHVKLTQEGYDKLCETLGKEVVDVSIDQINNKIDAKGPRYAYKDYAAGIREWARSPYFNMGGTSPQTQCIERNIGLANAIYDHVPLKHPGRVVIGHDYIELIAGNNVQVIKFSDPSFREQCSNTLRKWGIPVDGWLTNV